MEIQHHAFFLIDKKPKEPEKHDKVDEEMYKKMKCAWPIFVNHTIKNSFGDTH